MSTPPASSAEKTSIRVRFAPSPTGELHIGGLRTALYNFLFARHNKGKFLIRIEDTDKKRQIKGATEKLLATLKEFNLESDEPIIIQSKRLSIYKKYAEQLVKSGHAYYCFCTPARLEQLRQQQQVQKQPPKYDDHCRNLNPKNTLALMTNDSSLMTHLPAGEAGDSFLMTRSSSLTPKPHVIRLKVPRVGETQFNDLIRGQVKFENKLLDDQVLLKSDGYPTYHLANVVDDHEMKITHVIRGEEWVSSTPKHILLYNAFNWTPPKFAHLPLLLNPDKSKLSKRQGDVAVEDYLKKGYLKEALINFIAFLGWNPGTDKEIYSITELIKDFKLEKVQKAGAIFNIEKLDWLNGWYIRQLPLKKLTELCLPYLIEAGFIKKSKNQEIKKSNLENIVKLAQDRLKRLNEIGELVGFIFKDKLKYPAPLLIPQKSTKEKTRGTLVLALSTMKQCNNETMKNTDKLRSQMDIVREKNGFTRQELFWPMRIAVSGQKNSPDVFDIIIALGKKETIKRIELAMEKLNYRQSHQ